MGALADTIRAALEDRCLCERCLDQAADDVEHAVATLLRSTRPDDQRARDGARILLADQCRHCCLPVEWDQRRNEWRHTESQLPVCNLGVEAIEYVGRPLPVATPQGVA